MRAWTLPRGERLDGWLLGAHHRSTPMMPQVATEGVDRQRFQLAQSLGLGQSPHLLGNGLACRPRGVLKKPPEGFKAPPGGRAINPRTRHRQLEGWPNRGFERSECLLGSVCREALHTSASSQEFDILCRGPSRPRDLITRNPPASCAHVHAHAMPPSRRDFIPLNRRWVGTLRDSEEWSNRAREDSYLRAVGTRDRRCTTKKGYHNTIAR